MIEFQGNTYKSYTKLCQEFNVNLRTFARRKSKDMTLEQCLGFDESVKGRAITFEDTVFKSQAALLDHYKIPAVTYWDRIKRGLSQRQALGIDPYKPQYAGWQEIGLCNEEGIEIEKANYLLYEIINQIS